MLARTPPRPPAYDPNDPRYWDERDLETEARRTFQVCHECRMCVTYCGSFPLLFGAIDHEVDAGRAEGAEKVLDGEIDQVVDHCWQCKLCYIKCPYTEDEGAKELLDFPRLMARSKAQRARRRGIPLVDRLLGEPQLIGKLGGGPAAPIANLVNANRLVRRLSEPVTGLSADFPLPPIARESFPRWLDRHAPAPGTGDAGEVVLFSTCYGDFNFPEVPRAAVQVLEHNGWRVLRPEALTCCGMPNLDGGDVEAAKKKMQANVDALLPLVRRGLCVAVVGPTCGYTLKKEWPLYLGTPESREVAAAGLDLMEFLERLRREKKLDLGFSGRLGKVAYHAPCHLRAQKIGFPGARVLGAVPGTEVRMIERCSAVDGTWGMKAEFYDEGARYAARLIRAIDADEPPDLVVTDCSLAGMRIYGERGTMPLHPVQALARVYGLDAPAEA